MHTGLRTSKQTDSGDSLEIVAEEPPSSTTSNRLAYQPALDGLRGLALIAIVVYHSGSGWAPGAFLSVSTFFTLSGFLITSLLILELESAGRISLKQFMARRLRRLLPAALVAIAAITALSPLFSDSSQLNRLRGDGLASLLNVANWHFVLAGDSYGAAFTSQSPFTHFWTLAIEEQFYIVFPLVLVAIATVAKGSRRRIGGALTALAAASVLWSIFLIAADHGIDRTYFGTDTRLPELLLGGVFALWWLGRPAPTGRFRQGAIAGSGAALVAVAALWATAERSGEAWYRGGLSLYTLLTLAVIYGAVQSGGPVRRLLGLRPLVEVGKVSYGAYLVHWPILLWLQQHTELAPWSAIAIGLPVALVVAGLLQRFVERPIRHGTGGVLASVRGTVGIAALSVAAVAVVVVVVARVSAPTDTDIAFDDAKAAELDIVERAEAAGGIANGAPRVGTFGDSAALLVASGLNDWGEDNLDKWIPAGGNAGLGCGVLTNVVRLERNVETPVPDHCKNWLSDWKRDLQLVDPDISVMEFGGWEVVGQQINGEGPFRVIGEDDELDALIEAKLTEAVDLLLSESEIVVVLTNPDTEIGRLDGKSPDKPFPESDPVRMDRFNEMLRTVAATDPRIQVIDLAAWVEARPDERELRPDGVHFTTETAPIAADWLALQILDLWNAR